MKITDKSKTMLDGSPVTSGGWLKQKWPVLAVWVLFASIVIYFSLNVIWLNDDLYYQHIYEGPRPENYVPIRNFWDVLRSNATRYLLENGRFVIHVGVQIICALRSHLLFAILNATAILWLLHMILRAAGIGKANWKQWLLAGMLVILFTPTQMTPSRALNYPWLMAFTLWFVELFFNGKDYTGWKLAVISICSLLLGNGHEGITFAVGVAILIYAVGQKFKISRKQWFMAIGYLIGFLSVALAPGTLSRAETKDHHLLLGLFYTAVSAVPLLVAGCIVLWNKLRYHTSITQTLRSDLFWLTAIAAFYLLNWLTGWFTVRQGLYISYLSIILIIKNLHRHQASLTWLVIVAVSAGSLLWWQAGRLMENRMRYGATVEAYLNSPDGMVFVDYPNYGLGREIDYSYTLYPPHFGLNVTDVTKAMQHDYPGRQKIYQMPAATEEIVRRDQRGDTEGIDFNRLLQVENDPRQHIIAIDRRRPRTFSGHRRLLGLLSEQTFTIDDCWPIYRGDAVDIYYVYDIWPLWVVTDVKFTD